MSPFRKRGSTMGRHGRHSRAAGTTAGAAPRGHRTPRRRRSTTARAGLLGACAAVAVGTAAVIGGVLPNPMGPAGDAHLFGGGSGDATRAGGAPTALTTDDGTAIGAGGGTTRAASPSPSRTGARPSTPVSRRPAAGASATPSGASASAGADAAVSAEGATAAETAAAHDVLTLVDKERSQAGCRPLTLDPKLAELAQDYSEEMASRGFFSHTDPDGRTPWNRAAALGISDLGGENIAEGQADADAVMDAWMHSAGHRANILDCSYHTIGIGVHDATGTQTGGPWWTQDFGY